ncbi:MAG: trigger factor [Pyrinomonas sp.]|uniref:trigger factor n=1 Tax=Pyrinomonas sp. TaxID=2080306 RepID=UPI003317F92E
MKTEVIDISPTRKELRIEIEAERIRAEVDRVSNALARHAAVPGFRPGRAPQAMVRQRYKKEIRGEVLGELIPQALSEALQQHPFDVIGEPQLRFADVESLERLGSEPLTIHAAIEVLPRVELGQYRGIELVRRIRPVTDEEIEEVLAQMRESSAVLVPVEDRGAQTGDTVTVNLRGRFVDDPQAEEIKIDEVDVVLGEEGVLSAFNENLQGVHPEEAKSFTVEYPPDYKAQGLAGKRVEYTAQVIAVRRKELPEMDDEWAKSMGEGISSLDELRQQIRQRLEGYARQEAERRLRDEAIKKLLDAHQFEVPATLVQREARRLLETSVQRLMQMGIDPRNEEIRWDEVAAATQQRAEENVRAELLLERIAEQEEINVSDEEIEAEIERFARAIQESPERVRAALTKEEAQHSIASGLRQQKALTLVIENAKIRDEEWRPEARAEEEASTETSAASASPSSDAESSGSTSDSTSEQDR